MMSSIILYLHLDLGDQLICNGLVREYCKRYDTVAIFSKPQNYPSVSFMFRDLPNIEIIQGDNDFAKLFMVANFFSHSGKRYDEAKIIGYPYLDQNAGMNFEQQFYQRAGIDFEKKWTSFHVQRDPSREESLFKKIAPKDDYIFLHDDLPRGFKIERKRLPKKYPVVFPEKDFTDNIFDYCTTLTRAKEIHVFDSSFMFLVDCLEYRNSHQKLFIHRYARPNFNWTLPILKKEWEILH